MRRRLEPGEVGRHESYTPRAQVIKMPLPLVNHRTSTPNGPSSQRMTMTNRPRRGHERNKSILRSSVRRRREFGDFPTPPPDLRNQVGPGMARRPGSVCDNSNLLSH